MTVRAAPARPARARPAPRPVGPRGRGQVAKPRTRAPARPLGPRTRGQVARAARPRVRVGRLMVPLIALLLAGIVWVNVATLSLTTATGQVVEEARGLEAETVRLRGDLDQRDGSVDERARVDLGMIDPPAETVRFLDVAPATP